MLPDPNHSSSYLETYDVHLYLDSLYPAYKKGRGLFSSHEKNAKRLSNRKAVMTHLSLNINFKRT